MKIDKGQTELTGVKEIARRANVSTATVDRVLHNRVGVSAATREKITAIIKELNYKPNILASRLASPGKFDFSVLLPDISPETDFWQAPLNGIKRAENAVNEYGISIHLYFFDLNDRNSFKEKARQMLEDDPDGVLFAPYFNDESLQFGALCSERNIPYVLIDSTICGLNALCYIGPQQFQSGYLGGQLMNYMLADRSKILLTNIAKEVEDLNNLIQIEEGFRAYFKEHHPDQEILKIDIKSTDHSCVEKEFFDVFNNYKPHAIFVTNSRVSTIARCLEKAGESEIYVIGYDFLEKNLNFLKKDLIDILICHRPEKQGYTGIMKLYEHFVLKTTFPNKCLMPIDIITRENHEYYDN